MPKVFVFAPTGNSHQFLAEKGCEVVTRRRESHEPGTDYESEIIGMARDADALAGTSMRSSPITRRVLEAAPDLRIVAKSTVGVDDIDVEACTEMGIIVTHAPVESNWGNIAEVTVTLMLSLLKGLQTQDATIGGRVAHLMHPWNIKILAYDPYVPDHRFLEFGAEPVDLETLLRESDVVTMHVVLNKETRHMMSHDQFAMMKRSAYFINTSRGGAHDEKALADAMEGGLIAGCGLNAFEDEPLPLDSPLRGMGHRILMRPHGGTPLRSNVASTEAPVGRAPGQNSEWVNTDVLKALRGELPVHIFNHEAVPLWLARFGGKPVLESQVATP